MHTNKFFASISFISECDVSLLVFLFIISYYVIYLLFMASDVHMYNCIYVCVTVCFPQLFRYASKHRSVINQFLQKILYAYRKILSRVVLELLFNIVLIGLDNTDTLKRCNYANNCDLIELQTVKISSSTSTYFGYPLYQKHCSQFKLI